MPDYIGDNDPNVINGSQFTDSIEGLGGNDTLNGLGEADYLEGGPGADVLNGGDGIDTATYSGSTAFVIVNLAANTGQNGDAQGDTFAGIENVHGTDFNDTLVGNGGDNQLGGGEGIDRLTGGGGNDSLIGGGGDDILIGGAGPDGIYAGAGNFDFIDYIGSPAAVIIDLVTRVGDGGDAEGDAINDVEQVGGSNFDDSLTGDGGDNFLRGNNGNDILKGGGGADTLLGDIGSDTAGYINSNVGVNVSIASGRGFGGDAEGDTLATIENLIGSPLGDNLIGNAFANRLTGAAGNDTLDGLGGIDDLIGGAGDDQYFVDNANDKVTEAAGEGTADRIFTSVSYFLASGTQVERLTTTDNFGTGAIILNGNEFAQAIFGNAGVNTLDGRGGGDTLVGMGGDDLYFIRSAADQIVERAGEGTGDRAFATVSYTLGAAARVEKLTTDNNVGTAAINLTGNGFVQTIFGNAGANTLDGGGGGDTLVGMGGDDFYFIRSATDQITEGAGEGAADRVFATVSYTLGAAAQVEKLTTDSNVGTAAINLTGNGLAQAIFGNAGANTLNGKAGVDTLVGMSGADTFAFDTAPGAGNIDAVADFNVADDTIQLENAIFTALPAGPLGASAFLIGAGAADGSDRVIYNNINGALLYDADGTAGGPAVQIATLATGLALTNADFIVV